MKIGILSMQRIRNYGSFLQAYSLKKNVELLGHDVQFVDYKVESAINKPASTNNKKSIMDVLTFLRRRIYKTRNEKLFLARKEFKKRYDTEFFDMLGLTREANYTPKLDTLVIGSDEVFNCLQTIFRTRWNAMRMKNVRSGSFGASVARIMRGKPKTMAGIIRFLI